MRQFVVLALLVSINILKTFGENCPMFKAFKDDTGEEIKDICIEEYGGKGSSFDCKEFENSLFNRSLLPPAFTPEPSIFQPSSFMVNPYQHEKSSGVKKYLVSGLDLSWKSPSSGLAKKELQGFLFFYYDLDNRNNYFRCRLIHLNTSKTYIDQKWAKVRFTYRLEVVKPDAEIQTKVFSVPTPNAMEIDDLVVRGNVKTATLVDVVSPDFGPGNWKPSVALWDPQNGSLVLSLSLSPAIFNFTIYELQLIKRNYSEIDRFGKTHVLKTQVRSAEKSYAQYVFGNLEDDEYRVVVNAFDPFHKEQGKCLCWVPEINNQKFCKLNCKAVSTPWFKLTKRKITVTSCSQDQDNPSCPDELLIPLLIAGSICIVFLLLCTGTYLYRKGTFMNSLPGSSSTCTDIGDKKTIYMLYSEDNSAHIQFTDALATFLEVCCGCKVIYRPWSKLKLGQDGLTWVVSHMNSADLVLFVASEGAQRLIEADNSRMVYKKHKVGPEGDLFMIGVRRLLLSLDTATHVRMAAVHTGKTPWCQKQLLFPEIFQLPNGLSKLLDHIHQTKTNDVFSSKVLLEQQEGKELLSSLEVVQKFEKDNPTWFENEFGPALPKLSAPLQSQVSYVDSDYGSLSPEQSLHNVTCSPVSESEGPDFNGYLKRYGCSETNPDAWRSSNYEDSHICVEIGTEKITTDLVNDEARSVVTVPSQVDEKIDTDHFDTISI